MALVIITASFFLARKGAAFVSSRNVTAEKPCIVIDAGHGGDDPGKIGVNDALEKDINLSIALQLKELFDAQDQVSVVLTRESDSCLADAGVKNQKVSDMQNRCKLITEVNPVFTVSIHQNSYTTPDIKGAQVFYYSQSEAGKTLADTLQNSLIANVDPENHRLAKANDSYYLLKKTPTPTVIVECGFLSNPAEADLLLTDEYQQKIVAAVYQGIMDYMAAEEILGPSSGAPSSKGEREELLPSSETPPASMTQENNLKTPSSEADTETLRQEDGLTSPSSEADTETLRQEDGLTSPSSKAGE